MADRQPLLHDLAVALRSPTVSLSRRDGQIRPAGVQGVLCGDVRVLGQAVVTVDGVEPEPVAHGVDGASAEYFVGLLRDLGDQIPDPTVWLRRDRRVRGDGLDETFTLVNRSDRDLQVELCLVCSTDLAAVETIKSGAVPASVEPVVDADVSWAGSDVEVTLSAPGARIARDGLAVTLRWTVIVPTRGAATRDYSLSVIDERAIVAPAPVRLGRPTTVAADDPRLALLLNRALDDLDALLSTEVGHDGDPFAAAGAPWFLTLFGRDSLWTATLLLPVDVRVAAGTLRTLARAQGTVVDHGSGEEPGKILHERRRADTVHIESGQGTDLALPALYYGTVDATALWICLLRDAWRAGMPRPDVEALLPNLIAALGWLAAQADRSGFLEYFDTSGRGLSNQGWKDSGDAVRFSSGAVAEGPVALVEVQGYAYEAAWAGAELLEEFGLDGADRWRAYAASLATRFRERFWVADASGPFPALALDGAKQPVDALTSNIGHLLGTGIVDETESDTIGRRLLAPDMASGYGLRTMSSAAGGYSPLSYHCGSVWPHDTAIVVRGLARSGQTARAAELARQILAAADGFDRRLPELFGGFGTDEAAVPVPYPAACRPQAWSAAAAVAVLQAMLGLTVDVPAGVVTLRPPSPMPVGALRVRGLRLGDGLLDIDIDRDGTVTHVAAPAGMRVVIA